VLTKLTISNFKRLEDVEIDLGKSVVFIGPNNSGKTSALQALALWHIGLQRVWEKKESGSEAKERVGVALNRKDLVSVPVPEAALLWRGTRVTKDNHRVLLEITVEGETKGKNWVCGLAFRYENEESLYCMPRVIPGGDKSERMPVSEEAAASKASLMPPMSGLTAEEPLLLPGRVSVLLGEGRTAEVLRNLCYAIYEKDKAKWAEICGHIDRLFNAELEAPYLNKARGDIKLQYREEGTRFDLSSMGRGCQQTLLLLAHLYANPGSVLLLDEPDAHLEFLRQREVYSLICEVADKTSCQIIAASHSEVVMNSAADTDHTVVAFLGKKPHRVNKSDQLKKALTTIGWEQYYGAEKMGWVLYLEGTTDLEILRRFARKLEHPVAVYLEAPFFKPICNQPSEAEKHFRALKEAKPDLVGVAIYDKLDRDVPDESELVHVHWKKCEIENYLASEKTLRAWAASGEGVDLFSQNRSETMSLAIGEIAEALRKLGKDPWSAETKVSDEFLVPLFKRFYEIRGEYNLMPKAEFYRLADVMGVEEIESEVKEKLDLIFRVAMKAKPVQ